MTKKFTHESFCSLSEEIIAITNLNLSIVEKKRIEIPKVFRDNNY